MAKTNIDATNLIERGRALLKRPLLTLAERKEIEGYIAQLEGRSGATERERATIAADLDRKMGLTSPGAPVSSWNGSRRVTRTMTPAEARAESERRGTIGG